MIEIKEISKIYGTLPQQVYALDHVSLKIQEGEVVAITGKSGSGKTTLMNLVGGMDTPTSGEIYVNEKQITGMKEKSLALYRRREIGFVFQFFNLIPVLTVKENITLPVTIDGKEPDVGYLQELLTTLGLEEKANSFPHQLSGGQQQRTAIGRALIHKPKIILADEPTGNLDTVSSNDILELLFKCREKYEQTLVIVTHDNQVAESCDRIVQIKDGRVIS